MIPTPHLKPSGFFLLLWLVGSSSMQAQAEDRQTVALPSSESLTTDRAPYGANPYLSFLPAGAEPDYGFWRREMARRAALRVDNMVRAGNGAPATGIPVIAESEPNDTSSMAQRLETFGVGDDAALDIAGTFESPSALVPLGPFDEDEGSLPLASAVSLSAGQGVSIVGTIGDGPFGSSGTGSGDLDFFFVAGAKMGQTISIDVEGGFDSFIGLYEANGSNLALNEDESPENRESLLVYPVPFDTDFYFSVAGSIFPFASLLRDIQDSSSGFGVGTEGEYSVEVGLDRGDPDWFEFDLQPCDVLGINLTGTGVQLQLIGPDGAMRLVSSQDLSGTLPDPSPLPGEGVATLAHVAQEAGTYLLRVLGTEATPYTLQMRVFRPLSEALTSEPKVFVDFDGATVDPGIFGVPPGMAVLSPLSDFLSRWGLAPSDLDAVIDFTLDTMHENLVTDPRFQGVNSTVALRILNSRDHADPGDDESVSRLIIGGSIAELGIPTIGIAQSIDVGNFDRSDTAIVLLDLLSGSAPDPNSLNTFALAPAASKVEFVGRALGDIASHEVGHYVGGYHTERMNDQLNLMDRGGDLPKFLGLGPDLIYGSEDDQNVDFVEDMFEPAERFAGFEQLLTRVSCALASRASVFHDGFESGAVDRWSDVVGVP